MRSARRTARPSRILSGLACLLFTIGLPAGPLNQWTWRFPEPQGSTLFAVTYGNGRFVAVGDNGTIITSGDGFHWTVQTYGIFPALLGVGYAGGTYVAVGTGGTILTSSNAVGWSPQISGTTVALRAVAGNLYYPGSGPAQFMAVGDGGTTLVSANGISWTKQSFAPSVNLNAVANSDGWFLIVGDAGTYVLYYDLASYWLGTTGVTGNLYAVVANDSWATLGGNLGTYIPPNGQSLNTILYSSDWLDFTAQTFTNSTGLWFPSQLFAVRAMAVGTNGFVAVGDTGQTLEYCYPGVVMTSTAGTNWIESPPYTSENRLCGAAYGSGLYVLVGDAGGLVVSSNLITWTEVTGNHRSAITAIACSANRCIASGLPMSHPYAPFSDFTTIVSSNGIDWSVSTVNLPAMTDLAAGSTQFVGINGPNLYTTTDGYSWQTNSPSSSTFRGVRYANGEFIAVGDNGSIFTSADGTNWNNASVATSGSLYGVAFGNGLYVAAGSVAATSPDGLSWTLCASNPPAPITRMVFGRGLFVAAAYTGSYYYPNGEIVTSQDGTKWQTRLTTPNVAITGIAYNGGTFLAISGFGAMFTSSDGTNWVNTGSGLPLVDGDAFSIYYNFNALSLSYLGYYSTVASYRGTFLAAGLDGVLVQSGNTWNPPALLSCQATSNGFSFSYNQQIDVPYRVQASTDLINWESIYTGGGSGQTTNFVYPVSLNYPARFFRTVSP